MTESNQQASLTSQSEIWLDLCKTISHELAVVEQDLMRVDAAASPASVIETARRLLKNIEGCVQQPLIDSLSSIAMKDVVQIAPVDSHPEFVLGGVEVIEQRRRALMSFKGLAEGVEGRTALWDGRSSKILYGCLLINKHLPQSMYVDELQLQAAVYMHDVFMSLLPDKILLKKSRYEAMDIMLLQQHPIQAYEMLRQMPDWQEAASMVLEHHERYDGQGYPHGVSGDGIHIGAQIIALMDAFYSMTHLRSDREYKKSVIRAVMELNSEKGVQFNPVVIEALNKATLELTKSNSLLGADIKLAANT